VPALLLVMPELALAPEHRPTVRRWLRDAPTHIVTVSVGVVVVVGIETLASGGAVHLHWLAIPLLAPVLVAATRCAVAGGLLTTGVVGVVYVVEVVRHVAVSDPSVLYREMTSSYLNVLAFGVAAVVAGLASGRSRSLLAELEANRHVLERSFDRVVVALAAAIEAKDPTTEGHVQRVARLAEAVGRELGFDDDRLRVLRYAAVLHDVGKIGVPEQVLRKNGPLDDDERLALERHVEIGVDIIRNVDILAPAMPFIRYHQERWDGCRDGKRVRHPGYFGLAGEEIPLEARIIAAVDAWDAMTSDRPYRAALEPQRALEEMRREAGGQFDPVVVHALEQVLAGRPLEAPVAAVGEPSPITET
jgi:putative nucleotidyltransferase with HDIG domain